MAGAIVALVVLVFVIPSEFAEAFGGFGKALGLRRDEQAAGELTESSE